MGGSIQNGIQKMNRSLSYQFEKRSCCNESRLGLLDVVQLAIHQPITSFSLYLRSGFHKNQFEHFDPFDIDYNIWLADKSSLELVGAELVFKGIYGPEINCAISQWRVGGLLAAAPTIIRTKICTYRSN